MIATFSVKMKNGGKLMINELKEKYIPIIYECIKPITLRPKKWVEYITYYIVVRQYICGGISRWTGVLRFPLERSTYTAIYDDLMRRCIIHLC